MLAFKFTFTANRYHATQWSRHVNEGVLEWPPSPWRILRGIVATWRRTLPDTSHDRVEPHTRSAVVGVSELPPTACLYGYTPDTSCLTTKGRRERTTLVLDPFVAIQPKRSLFAVWPTVELDSQQRSDLKRILRNMPYLGRAESWVSAELDDTPTESSGQ